VVRTSWVIRTIWHISQVNGRVISCLGTMILCPTTLAVLLVIGGVEKNPGPGVDAEKILHVLCSGRDRNFKSGTQCNTSGHWFHNSCGNVTCLKIPQCRVNGRLYGPQRQSGHFEQEQNLLPLPGID
jgi:hypothetical protein